MKYSEEVAEKLNNLLTKNYDSEKGYKLASEKAKSSRLKSYFDKKAQERYDFGHQLKSEIADFGESPDKGSSLKADAHRGWMNIKSALSMETDEAILEEAVRGEKAAVEEYNEVLQDSSIPPSTGNVLVKQRNSIKEALNEVKSMEEWKH